MDDAPSYMPPIALDDPVRATTVGQVHASDHPDYAPGDWVMGLNAIEEYSAVVPDGFTAKVDVSAVDSPSRFLSAFGAVGLTAYFGLLEVAKPQPGETVLVSGAAGAVGSVVGQIAKIHGCRTVGIAGGPDKCARLVERYGYDVTDGRKAVEAFQRRWRPERIDGEIDGEVRAILFQLLLDRDRGTTR